ncbi:DUF4333 domain-containing protein [Spirillospora sp. NPDC000708]|uniref:DUF4333 domain-containing protein n=1 Tax=Actinomadura nitritigenes TaxID=134602 RepID=UPI003351F054
MRTSLIVPALLGGLLLGAAGCGLSGDVPGDMVQDRIRKQLGPEYDAAGIGPIQAFCPGRLRSEVGAKITCAVYDSKGRKHRVIATVTSVDGWDVRYSLKKA